MKAEQILPLIPFVLPATISTTHNTKCGRGMIVPVTVAANTDKVITHNLGRLVQGLIPLINNGGASLPPKLFFGGNGTRSTSQQTIQGDVAMSNCLVWVF